MKGKGKDMSKVELTETQKNIIQIRKRMNRRSIEEEKFNGFTKKKMVVNLPKNLLLMQI